MALVTTPYFHIECNGPAPTPMHEHCTATVDGSFNGPDVQNDARRLGWVETGRSWFCPRHKPTTDTPKRRKATDPEVTAA